MKGHIFGKILLVMMLFSGLAMANEPRPVSVSYNPEHNSLSVKADGYSLKAILSQVAVRTGIEVGFDPQAERDMTIQFEEMPLERALKNLLRGTNNAFRYSSETGRDGSQTLIGVQVLQPGSSPSAAERLISLEREAVLRVVGEHKMSRRNREYPKVVEKRWEARLKELPAKFQEKLLEHAEKKLNRYKERMAEREKSKAEKKAKRDERKNQREARRYAGMSPEEIEQDKALRKERQQMTLQRYRENNPPE